jgi:hypothetical protein
MALEQETDRSRVASCPTRFLLVHDAIGIESHMYGDTACIAFSACVRCYSPSQRDVRWTRGLHEMK